MAFLEMRDVCKGYDHDGERTDVLTDINLEIDEGEMVAIVGFSGAGKTTLLSMMAGLIAPDRGEIFLEGRRITGPGTDRGVVFQNYSLLPWKSVFGNIYLAVDQVFRDWTKSRKEEWTDYYISLVNLSAARHQKPAELSGGMRQRVALARALAINPRVLLMDEPLGALDALTRATLQDEMARICTQDRTTMVLITNDVDEAILLADRIVPLSAGPNATFGPSVAVDLARPRDRLGINHDPGFRRIRGEVIDYLLGSRRQSRSAGRRVFGGELCPQPVAVGA